MILFVRQSFLQDYGMIWVGDDDGDDMEQIVKSKIGGVNAKLNVASTTAKPSERINFDKVQNCLGCGLLVRPRISRGNSLPRCPFSCG